MEIIRDLESAGQSPHLPLVQFIANSEYSAELFGGVFLSGLLLSDSPDFEWGVHMLRIEHIQGRFLFQYERGPGPGGFKDNLKKEVLPAEAIETLDLFLKVKYGLNLRMGNRCGDRIK